MDGNRQKGAAMNRLDAVFANRNHKALVAYVTAGFPSTEATLETVPMLVSLGCDIIELGIPFSDPLADGITIQDASQQALAHGVSVETCLNLADQLRRQVTIPLVFMTYYNPVLRYGVASFCMECRHHGIDGLIIPDLPPEEAGELVACSRDAGLAVIYLLAPNSRDERIAYVAEQSHGFIYLVSLLGTTGARAALPADLEAFVARVRRATTKPLCVGFGVSTAGQARRIAKIADGVIVGSRLLQLMKAGDSKKLASFVTSLRKALDTASTG